MSETEISKYNQRLEDLYLASKNSTINEYDSRIKLIVDKAEFNRGLYSVLLTCLIYKDQYPLKDCRKHQAQMEEGFSGRRIDTQYVTPFLKQKKFPHMAESGWLTRSLEQAHPYDLNYPASFRDNDIKVAFLSILDEVEKNILSPSDLINQIFKLTKTRQDQAKELSSKILEESKDLELGHDEILKFLINFMNSSSEHGSSKIPVIIVKNIFESYTDQLKSYEGLFVQKLKSHTASDLNSGGAGDIEITNSQHQIIEAVEVKSGKDIDESIIETCMKKLDKFPDIRKYWIISTEVPTQLVENSKIKIINLEQMLSLSLNLMQDSKIILNKILNDLIEDTESIKSSHKQRLLEFIKNQKKI